MNKKGILCSSLFIALVVIYSCQKDVSKNSLNSPAEVSSKATGKPSSASSSSSCANYVVSLSRTYENGKTTFIWTITNPAPGNGKDGTIQDLSHWTFVPGCSGDLGLEQNWSDLLKAEVSFDGTTWNLITPTPSLAPDPSQDCSNANVFKFNYGTSGGNATYYKIVVNGNYAQADDNFAVFKSGANTGCCTRLIPGIGCKQDEFCSFSQGYYFASPNPWPADPGTVTVGGFVYTEAEGRAIWNCSNAGGIKDAKKGFTQVAALILSGAYPTGDASIDADVVTIQSWLATKGKLVACSNLPDQTAGEILTYGDAAAAAGRIGEWINLNHCEE